VCVCRPLPPFRASVKDGYAVIAADGCGDRKVLSLAATAGQSVETIQLTPGHCMRISTGAPVPSGCDAVVQVEDTKTVELTQVLHNFMVHSTNHLFVSPERRRVSDIYRKGAQRGSGYTASGLRSVAIHCQRCYHWNSYLIPYLGVYFHRHRYRMRWTTSGERVDTIGFNRVGTLGLHWCPSDSGLQATRCGRYVDRR
jgi:hypothetical protein